MNIAITGGIGSGKSTAGKILQDLGYVVVNCDDLARREVSLGSNGLKQVVQLFGRQILLPDGNLNRKALAQLIFSNDSKREQLNQLMHPLIKTALMKQIQCATKTTFYEVPLLFETDSQVLFDVVITVTASVTDRLQRIVDRDHCNNNDAQARMDSQWTEEDKIKNSDFVVTNSGSVEQLKLKLIALIQEQAW